MLTGRKRIIAPPPSNALLAKFTQQSGGPTYFFGDADGNHCTKYAVLESDKVLTVHVMRCSATGPATIKYKTADVEKAGKTAAKAGEDYVATSGTLSFAADEFTKDVQIEILDDDEVEEDEKFHLIIYEPSETNAKLDNDGVAEVTIVDDDEPGEIGFDPNDKFQTLRRPTSPNEAAYIVVKRFNGSSGAISLEFRTEAKKLLTPLPSDKVAAIDGIDFVPVNGALTFAAGEIEKKVQIEILALPSTSEEKDMNALLEVVLFNCVGPIGGRGCLTDISTSQVTIVDDSDAEQQQAILDIAARIQAENDEKYSVETTSWSGQFSDAIRIERDDGDENKAWTKLPPAAIITHCITMPWKVIFALCPPTIHYNGWATFTITLLMIGVVTGFIGDLAGLFGCSIGMPDSVTAISFVALGTSLPDTFASMAAVKADDSADAAIGNVTGSNAVNVFLGLGMPWLIASIFWEFGTADQAAKEKWVFRYDSDETIYAGYIEGKTIGDISPAFVVLSGALGASVDIFCVCALICVALLSYRRKYEGGELGGDPAKAKLHALFLVGLWIIYIVGSVLTSSS